MEYIVDMQGFQKPINEFVLKELAVLCLQDSQNVLHFFQPPYSYKELPSKYKATNSWLTRNFHGLSWDNGYLPYDIVDEVIKSALLEASIVYVKGIEKKLFLEKHLGDSIEIIDLDEIECPSLRKLSNETNVKCIHHDNTKFCCALKNVHMLKAWLCNVEENV